jgi:hypothetical protein
LPSDLWLAIEVARSRLLTPQATKSAPDSRRTVK